VDLIKDMKLFVRIVHSNGLAAAGRELGMTPSNVTMRIKNLEKHYQVKLLKRTTRSISLTDEGREFYNECLQILENIDQLENKLKSGQEKITGSLKVTATSDLGRQHIAPLLNQFASLHPEVSVHLNLNDAVSNLAEDNLDLAIRYGVSFDSQLIAKKLATNYRVLCASPEYIKQRGSPKDYTELVEHSCLTMMQARTHLTSWYFQTPQGEKLIRINPSRSSDDGAMIRQWAVEGAGIALKSIWDIKNDLETGRLVSLFDELKPNYQSKSLAINTDLYAVYADRKYLPKRTRELIKYTQEYFAKLTKLNNIIIQ